MRLQSYLRARRITQAQFAAEIGVTPQSIYRYIHEGRVPEPPVMARIVAATNEAVMPNDFHRFPNAAPSPCERCA